MKWFADYNLLCPPRSPQRIILGEYFLAFCAAVGIIMAATAHLDHRLVATRSLLFRFAAAVTDRTQPHFALALRLGVSAFFTAAAIYGGFILTPELETYDQRIVYLHVAVAVCALIPHTAGLAGAGIAALYLYAVLEYGLFHLLDYPVFLGVAAFLIIHSVYGRDGLSAALTVLRLSAGMTLLWAGIEKFAYPEWSFALLTEKPSIAFGFEPEFYMVAAGFVEFCCAWLLITGMLAARAAALVLLSFFVSAIYYFGLIDAIGHSGIIVVLLLLTLSRNPLGYRLNTGPQPATAALHTAAFFVALLLFIGLYAGGHSLSYGPYRRLFQCLV